MTEPRGRGGKRSKVAKAKTPADVAPVGTTDGTSDGMTDGAVPGAAVMERAATADEATAGATSDDAVTATLVDDILSDEAIRTRAYELYVERGRTAGHELEDWLAAERALRGRTMGDTRRATTSP